MTLTALAIYKKMFGDTTYRPSNIEDAWLALLLLAINADSPSSDVMTYLNSLTGAKADIAVDRIAQKLNYLYDQVARGAL